MINEPTRELSSFIKCAFIIVRSAFSAGLVIFTNRVWFFIYLLSVYFATMLPVTSSHKPMVRLCMRGVSRPSFRIT